MKISILLSNTVRGSICVTSPTVKDKAMRKEDVLQYKERQKAQLLPVLLKLEEVTNIFNLLDCEILPALHYSQFLLDCLRVRTRGSCFCSAGDGVMGWGSQATQGQRFCSGSMRTPAS